VLGLFRKNLFINLILLLLFTAALRSYFFISGESAKVDWIFNQVIDLNSLLGSNIIQVIASIILIGSQGILLSNYVTEHRLSRELSVITGAIFILFVSSILEPKSFSVILIANLFCVLSFGSLFKIYKRYKPIATIFNSGFYLAIATVFYIPYIIFFIPLIFGLLSLRSFNLKEFFQLLSGFICAYFLISVLLFNLDGLSFYYEHIVRGFSWLSFDFSNLLGEVKMILLTITTVILFTFQNSLRKKKKFDAIKKIELVYWALFLGFLILFFTHSDTNDNLILLSCPVAILGGLIMESKDKKMVKEFVFAFLIVAYVIFVFGLV